MKILLAYDGFEHSENALASAVELANTDEGAQVTILSVVAPDARASHSGGHVGMRPHAHEDVARGHAYLRERGIESEMQMEEGDPAEEIVRVAREGAYDVIVTGTHGRGPIGEILLGSVSKTVVRTAPCAVLVAGKEARARIEPPAA